MTSTGDRRGVASVEGEWMHCPTCRGESWIDADTEAGIHYSACPALGCIDGQVYRVVVP